MKKKNKLDDFYERIYNVVVNVKGSNLLLEDAEMRDLFFNILLEKLFDIQAFTDTYTDVILKGIDNSINATLLDFNKSKYKKQINSSQFTQEVYNSKYEFIRHAYVIGFHKFEAYAKNLEQYFNNKIRRIKGFESVTFNNYSETKFGIAISQDWHKFQRLHTIQFICNSSKHSNGYPISKYEKPEEFKQYPENQKIERTSKVFREDMLFLSNLTVKYFELFNSILLHCDQVDGLANQEKINSDAADLIAAGKIEPFDVSQPLKNIRDLESRINEIKTDVLYSKYLT